MIIKKCNQKYKEKISKENADIQAKDEVIDENTNTEMPEVSVETPQEEIDLFDIEHIDFEQRQERRRGSRRRGYRRIDDRNLISRAKEESENIKKYAYDEGYSAGIKKATEDLQIFREQIAKFMNAKKEVFEFIAPDILEISVDIAKKIIKRELESNPQIILDTIIDVLRKISKTEAKVIVRAKPDSVEFIKDSIPNYTYQYGIDTQVNVIADPSIEDGGCIFQTNNGIVDASVNTQLEIIKKALEGA